jgi:hypothetical protein
LELLSAVGVALRFGGDWRRLEAIGGKILQKLGRSAIIMTWISPMDHDNHHNKRKRGSKIFRVLEVEL